MDESDDFDIWQQDNLIATVPVTARSIVLVILTHGACLALGALLAVLAVRT